MTLTKGQRYDMARIAKQFSHFGVEDESGYNLYDYFQDGMYLGPDAYGVEPIFLEEPVDE